MGLTQKYKQTQRQVRVQTNESNYAKGMWYSDSPIPEGYSKVLINYDIDTLSGVLKPRKGFRTVGFARPQSGSEIYLENTDGFNILLKSKLCAASTGTDSRNITRKLQAIIYNTASKHLSVLTCKPELASNTYFTVAPCYKTGSTETVMSEPYCPANPGIHNKACIHTKFFDTPVGTFAFDNSYYTFVKRTHGSTSTDRVLCYTKRCADLQDNEILFDDTKHVEDLRVDTPEDYCVCIAQPDKINSTEAASWGYNMLLDNPYDFVCEETAVNNVTILGIIPYDKNGLPALTPRKNQDITLKGFYRAPRQYHSNREISAFYATRQRKIDEYYETADAVYNIIKTYYELVSEEYVETEDTAFDPEKTYYEHRLRDPRDWDEIKNIAVTSENYGDWWYCTEEKAYYMVQPDLYETVTPDNNDTAADVYFFDHGRYYSYSELPEFVFPQSSDNTQLGLDDPVPDTHVYYKPTADSAAAHILFFGTSKPRASEKLAPTNSTAEDKIHIRWQIRESGASDWLDLKDGDLKIKLSDYMSQFGEYTPFTITTTLPSNEVLIRLLITDPEDSDATTGEEYTLSVNTIGLSLVSDELSTALNIPTAKFDLAQCTGMLEWQKHLVLWGVPGALNTLFVSDVNNPTFFPYPNNIDTFTEPIVSVYNYGNELLVLTTSALYRLVWDSEGTGWTQRLIQQNLHVTEADAKLACVFKNLFFFKSGEFYYIMTPKVSAKNSIQGSTSIVQVSKPIEQLLNNFHAEIYDLVKSLSNNAELIDFTDQLVNYFTYIDGNKIVVNYVYALNSISAADTKEDYDESAYIYVQLIYDTDLQAWYLKVFQAPHMLYPTHEDTFQQNNFMDLTYCETSYKLYIQYFRFTEDRTDQTYQYIRNLNGSDCAVGVSNTYEEFCRIQQTTDTVAQPGKRYVDMLVMSYHTPISGTGDSAPDDFALDLLYSRRFNKSRVPGDTRIEGYMQEVELEPGTPISGTLYELLELDPNVTYYIEDPETNQSTSEAALIPLTKVEAERYIYLYKQTLRRINISNYQYLDTGSYELNTELKKRFREFQFKIKNNTPDNLRFHTAFLVDGSTRTDMYKYTASYVTDTATNDPVLVVTPELLDPNMAYDTTELGAWVLNQAMFPGKTLHKIRMAVSGKGYSPRVKLLSFNEKSYEILGHTWVYRTMNSR